MAKIARMAERAHRGQLYAGGGLFVAHLQRVVADVVELGGTETAAQAAWLHHLPAACVDVQEMLTRGVPAGVVRVVDILQQRPTEYPAAFTDRVLLDRRAALVRYAVLADWHRHLAGQHQYEYVRDQQVRLADALGLARPCAEPATTSVDVSQLIGWRPAEGEHWGPVARRLGAERGPHALPILLAAYGQLTGDEARSCCLDQVCSAIHAIAQAPTSIPPGQIDDLATRWWRSTRAWEERVAV